MKIIFELVDVCVACLACHAVEALEGLKAFAHGIHKDGPPMKNKNKKVFICIFFSDYIFCLCLFHYILEILPFFEMVKSSLLLPQ